MNERIRELAVQAELFFDVNGNTYPRAMSAEECEAAYKIFADSIIRECIANCDDINSMKYIADHFGINIEGLE